MHLHKSKAEITVLEAVDNLSHMAEVDLPLPAEPKKPLLLTEEQKLRRKDALSWQNPDFDAYNRERAKDTFVAIGKFLQNLDKTQLKDEEVQRGVQAIMTLVNEAVQKIDNYTEIFKRHGQSAADLHEYKDLTNIYLTKIVPILPKTVEPDWQGEWGAGLGEDKIGTVKGGLRDLESIRSDNEYELFLIRKEDGHPFYNRSLLRHLQLVGQFDFMLRDPTRENPLARMPLLRDKIAHTAAREILDLAARPIEEFYKEALKYKQIGFVLDLSKAVMALMLAANPRNLMHTALGKSSFHYYTDFQRYLRSAVTSKAYRRFLSHPPEQGDLFQQGLMHLTKVLCNAFFLKPLSKKETITFIHSMIEKGARDRIEQKQTHSPLSLWNNLLDQDDNIRNLLQQHPNGPLLMTLRLFTNEEQLRGFDALAQHNLTGSLYSLGDCRCIRLPSPTYQNFLQEAHIADEFIGFLRGQKHLLINLQDRTSWQEIARCKALEEPPTESLVTATFPKNTDFYHQSGNYLEQNDAKAFKENLKQQIAGKEQCGFHFPPEIDITDFTHDAIETIHKIFFAGKEHLVHKNRLDFIEIFYWMLYLKLIELARPDSFSFTCKDGIDAGAAASAGIFAFLRMMNGPAQWTKEEKDFLLWMLYAPALLIRERAIDVQVLDRMTSALTIIAAEVEAHPKQVLEVLGKVYETSFFNTAPQF